jgi:hypothetical protein
VQRGLISFKKSFYYYDNSDTYDNISIESQYSTCEIISASNLEVDGNSGYTTFYVEVVPVLYSGSVITVQQLCETESRNTLIEALGNGIWTVLENNVNFLYLIWLSIQTSAIVFVFIGIPLLVFLLIRWMIFKITGNKIFERKEEGMK